jgi:predicted transcriptional regulator of viral defense system
MQIKNTILSQSELAILESAIVKYRKIVTFDELATLYVGESRETIRKKVALLVQKGWLVRLKKGQYSIITSISTLGFNDLSEYVVAQTLQKDSYISFESALQYHGLFDQMLTTVGSVTTQYARKHTVQNTIYTYSRIKEELYFGFTTESFGAYSAQIAEQEKALLDMLYFRSSAYSVNIVLEKLREYKHRIDFEKLKQYAQHYGVGMLRSVGFLLDNVDVETNELLTRVKESKNSYNRLTKASTIFDAKWRLYYEHNALI